MMAADDRAERTLKIQNEKGFHAIPSTKFVQAASKFPCDIKVIKGDNEVSGKSILALLTLVAPKGTQLTIRATGERAEEAVAALAALIEDKFGEGK
jgi:phosphocarrier protein HPr